MAIQAGHAETQSRLCVHCYMRARTDLDEKKMYPCTACSETKHLRDFSPADQKEWLHGKGYCKWACYDCRCPLCEGWCQRADDE